MKKHSHLKTAFLRTKSPIVEVAANAGILIRKCVLDFCANAERAPDTVRVQRGLCEGHFAEWLLSDEATRFRYMLDNDNPNAARTAAFDFITRKELENRNGAK